MIDISAKFGIPNLLQSKDIRQNPEEDISNFWISGQYCINKLGPVTKVDKRNMASQKTLTMMSCQQVLTSSGSRIPDAWSIKPWNYNTNRNNM